MPRRTVSYSNPDCFSFLIKKNKQIYSTKPNNLKTRNSFHYNGQIQKKTVGVELVANGKDVHRLTCRGSEDWYLTIQFDERGCELPQDNEEGRLDNPGWPHPQPLAPETWQEMEEPPEEATGRSLEPESTARSPNDSHRDRQQDNWKKLGKEEADNQSFHRTANQANPRVYSQTEPNIFGQADYKVSEPNGHRTSDQADLRASNRDNVADHRATNQTDQGMSEQTGSKASHQADHVDSEQTDDQIPVLYEQRTPEQIDRRLSGQAERRISEQTDRRMSGQAERRISEQTDRRMSGQAERRTSEQTDRRLSGQAERRTSEQTDRRLSGQAERRTSEQTDRRMSGQAEQRTSEQTDRRMSGQAERRISEQTDRRMSGQAERRTSEQTDRRMSGQAERRTSEQTDRRLSGLVEQKLYEQIDQRLSEQTGYKTSVKTHHKVHDQVTELAEHQVADPADSGTHHPRVAKHDYSKSKEVDHLRNEKDDKIEDNQFDYGESDHRYDDRIFTSKKDKEADFRIQPCKFNTSQTDLSDSKVLDVTDSESKNFLQAFNSFENKFINHLQAKGRDFSPRFPTISTQLDYIISQDKSQVIATETNVSEHQDRKNSHEHKKARSKRFPSIVYQDPYQVSLQYMEKHHILQIFQQITENLVYERPADPLSFMLYQVFLINRNS
ncbi:testis-specific expressed protein 55 [Sturnira hondurensis]|uniref:testis-specific expressed protein 55 n=1 Tax=Sturnira hondurensis TaxID=192404 RepID=UPI00187917C7|nr:testis-specific expressed protein 55 [Sturnira hondurensis]